MSLTVRDYRDDDLIAISAMAEAQRVRHETFEPLFWKKAAASHELGGAYLSYLARQPDTLFLAAELDGQVAGFLVANVARVPPVVDPGKTAMIDDFCVARPSLWPTVGQELLDQARLRLRQDGFAQIVVVCGFKDAEKAAFLATQDLSLTSTWWTAPT